LVKELLDRLREKWQDEIKAEFWSLYHYDKYKIDRQSYDEYFRSFIDNKRHIYEKNSVVLEIIDKLEQLLKTGDIS